MAISRQQPMRPALDAALNALDTLESVPQDLSGITQSLSATNRDVLLLTEEINELQQDTVPDIEQRLATLESEPLHFKRGVTNPITVEGGASLATSVTFATPFSEDALCGVFPCVVTPELSTLFSIEIIDCTYSGFSFNVTNSDADAHSINVGYVAVDFS